MGDVAFVEKRRRVPILRSAITNSDGSVNVAYLSMFLAIWTFCGAVPCMIIGAFLEMVWGTPTLNPAGTVVGLTHTFNATGLGVGMGAAAGGLSTALAALALFLKVDTTLPVGAAPPPTPVSSTTTTTKTEVS